MGDGGERSAELVLLSRPDCHLCDEMRRVLDRVLPRWGLDYRVMDVDSDAALRRRYGETIPVLLADGRELARIRVSERRLERRLGRRFGRRRRAPFPSR